MKLVILASLLLMVGSVAQSAPLLNIQPVSTVAVPGDILMMNVDIASATDLAAIQFDITFTAGVLSASVVTEGAFLLGGGQTFFIPGMIDNTTGLISATASALIGGGPGVSGSGTLATIVFNYIGPGPARIDLANVFLLDSTGGQISPILEGAVVNNVPEPSTFGITALGLGAGAWILRSRDARRSARGRLRL
ncbi:MAG: PEP-CTERM sorting domain-containing protein [Bryobacterales bacterium]|nr:PEP-CTERM sorting domain-containing protein [Bryobacterales bacterium]